jgi:hypothetical protein
MRSFSELLNTKDFNLRIVIQRPCKKFKKQNALHVALHLYLKTQVRYAHPALRIKVTLMDRVDAAADTRDFTISAILVEI